MIIDIIASKNITIFLKLVCSVNTNAGAIIIMFDIIEA